ncbi:ferritin-like protein [Flavobacterium sp. SLB02]|jgi:hypothetical protein|uniref:ferritin-like domain-containing protein n=1 Tax=Flavobacterium sp. SLB02 TaxID=2665645 RepID=UPI0012A7E0C8|nr:ferritin-like protein [Flavobacterium sp. SLB02]QGK75275.1 hypothetical protein GIY83_14675 [Flavobacterium sp. SLB02]
MLQIDKELIEELKKAIHGLQINHTDKIAVKEAAKQSIAAAKDQLKKSLHKAMRLEASTVPPYLVAAWSIKDSPGYQNAEIRRLILSVAKEEMLHMMGVANIIAAMGEPPQIANKKIVLDWGVDKLPVGGNLIPQLAPFSMSLLTDLFMKIEEPKDPIHYVVLEREMLASEEIHYGTIGEFYDAIIALINALPEDPFGNGASYPQIKMEFDLRITQIGHDPIIDFVVTNKTEAIKILNWIVDQGEGSAAGPLDGNAAPAHYYRFAEIYKGGKLIKDTGQLLGYAYDRAGQPINCDFNAVRQFAPNPKMKDFSPDSRQYKGLMIFNENYTRMFKELQEFYSKSDNTQEIPTSINSMNTMTRYVDPLFNLNPSVCPSFEWIEPSPPVT